MTLLTITVSQVIIINDALILMIAAGTPLYIYDIMILSSCCPKPNLGDRDPNQHSRQMVHICVRSFQLGILAFPCPLPSQCPTYTDLRSHLPISVPKITLLHTQLL